LGKNDNLKKKLEELESVRPELQLWRDSNGPIDLSVPKALFILTHSVIRLDETSAWLSKVNIALTVVIIALTAVQVFLALHH
jgi:hypothetical protein